MTMIKGKLRARWAVLAGVAVLSPACTMLLGADKDYYYEDEGEGAGGSGQGGSGGQGAAGGHGGGGQGGEGGGLPPPPCTEDTDCPKESDCLVPVCENNTCGTVPAPDDTLCDGGQSVCQGGMCVCAPGLKDCNGNCVDTTSAPEHCGACGHSCQGGPCEASACLPFPIATGQDHPFGITLDGTHVYWTDYYVGTVMRVPLQGGAPETLSTGHVYPMELQVNASHVYWTESGDTSVWKVNLDGTGIDIEVAPTEIGPTDIVLDDENAYWIAEDDNSIRFAALDGGSPATLAGAQGAPRGITVYQNFLYWTNSTSDEIRRRDLMSGDETAVVTGTDDPRDIVADAAGIYWIAGSSIWRADLDGGNKDELANTQLGVKRLAVDDQHVYWTEFLIGDIRRAPKDGSGLVQIFVSDQQLPQDIESPWGIAVDATSVYWTDVDTHAIMKRAK